MHVVEVGAAQVAAHAGLAVDDVGPTATADSACANSGYHALQSAPFS
jgi:hypothetical protein